MEIYNARFSLYSIVELESLLRMLTKHTLYAIIVHNIKRVIWTAGLYAEYLKDTYYTDNNRRTVVGLYIELQVHYLLYLIGNSHGTDGSDMGNPDWDGDWTAALSELLARLLVFPNHMFLG